MSLLIAQMLSSVQMRRSLRTDVQTVSFESLKPAGATVRRGQLIDGDEMDAVAVARSDGDGDVQCRLPDKPALPGRRSTSKMDCGRTDARRCWRRSCRLPETRGSRQKQLAFQARALRHQSGGPGGTERTRQDRRSVL